MSFCVARWNVKVVGANESSLGFLYNEKKKMLETFSHILSKQKWIGEEERGLS